jgi:hypothetical protein
MAIALVAAVVGCSPAATVGPSPSAPARTTASHLELEKAAVALGGARATALRVDDERAWVATGSDPATFARMRLLGVEDYAVVDASTVGEAVGSTAAAPRWLVTVRLAFRLHALAPVQRTLRVEWLLAGTGGAWVVADERGIEGLPLWHLSGLTVDRVEGLVIAGTVSSSERAALRAAAATARQRVVDACGGLGPVLVVAPATTAELEQVTGRPLGSVDVAGLTQGPLDPTGRAHGDTVYVVPRSATRLTDVGLEAVLAHEMTHVALRSRARGPVPRWLEEGLAQEVAYRHLDVDRAELLRPLTTQLARVGLPSRLPTDADLDAGARDAQASYLSAWRAVHVLAERRGVPAVVTMYLACAAHDGAATGCEADVKTVFGQDGESFVTAWRADLAAAEAGHFA